MRLGFWLIDVYKRQGYHYQRSSEGQLIVVIDDERIIFRDIEKDDKSIPIEAVSYTHLDVYKRQL